MISSKKQWTQISCLVLVVLAGIGYSSAITTSTNALLTPTEATTAGDTRLKSCPLLMCTREYIPKPCREYPVIEKNGVKCYGCQQWKAECRNQKIVSDVTTLTSKAPSQCPEVVCTLELIPEECKEIPKRNVNGIMCEGCPVWRKGCKEQSSSSVRTEERFLSQVPCPILDCGVPIPSECEVQRTHTSLGQVCELCPEWREGCREEERQAYLGNPRGGVTVKCPEFICEKNIPVECQEPQSFQYKGNACYGCPTWSKQCSIIVQTAGQAAPILDSSCPETYCERVPGLHRTCYQREFYTYKGRTCERCPSIKTRCQQFEPPRPMVPERPRVDGGLGLACPLLACPTDNIPKECRIVKQYAFQGRMCDECPTQINGCVPKDSTLLDVKPLDPVIPDLACPLRACALILIPPECREEQTVVVKGKVCQDCPRWREGCVPNKGTDSRPIPMDTIEPELACPLMACPQIDIPKECLEEVPYQVRGKRCYKCPKWREGCVANEGSRSVPMDTTGLELACPLLACPQIDIPKECLEEVPYQVRGKTCYKCPKWREGCVATEGADRKPIPMDNTQGLACPLVACPKILIPAECREETPYQLQGKTCYRCPKWREGCTPKGRDSEPQLLPLSPPVQPLPQQPEIACPLMRCQNIAAPAECIVQQTFEFHGKTCTDCPTVRSDCPRRSRQSPLCPQIMCPNMQHIPKECLEEQTIYVHGQSCRMCPRWRLGCMPTPVLATAEVKQTSTTDAPATTSTRTNTFVPIPTPRENSILNLDGVLPVRDIISKVDSLACPPLPCPDMLIPYHCKEETTYQYQGRACRGCPRWRLGCQPSSANPFTINPNGILSFSLFNEMFV